MLGHPKKGSYHIFPSILPRELAENLGQYIPWKSKLGPMKSLILHTFHNNEDSDHGGFSTCNNMEMNWRSWHGESTGYIWVDSDQSKPNSENSKLNISVS